MPANPNSAVNDSVDVTETETSAGNVFLNDTFDNGYDSLSVNGIVIAGEGPTTVSSTFGTYTISSDGTYMFTPFAWVEGHSFFNLDLGLQDIITYSVSAQGETYEAELIHNITGNGDIAYVSSRPNANDPTVTEYLNEFLEVLFQVTSTEGTSVVTEFALGEDFTNGLANTTYVYGTDGQAHSETTLLQSGATTTTTYDYENEEEYILQTIVTNASGAPLTLFRALDNGGTVEATYTTNPSANVAARAKEYNAEGDLAADVILFNDDRLVRTQYDGAGVVDQVSYFDESDEGLGQVWESIVTEYEGGSATQRTITYDTGDAKITQYDAESGARTVGLSDGSNTRSWDLREKQFNAEGIFVGDHFVFDNGFDRTREYYEDGSLRRIFMDDGANTKSWDTLERVYDEAGDLASVYQVKDSGDITSSTYATGGILQTRVFIDGSETKDYYSKTYTYDAGGNIINTVTVEDGVFG